MKQALYTKIMKSLLNAAKKAAQNDEVPIAAAVLKDGEIVSISTNQREDSLRITGHAEILALEQAALKLGTRILKDCHLVVTVEPCLMCWGAILQARISYLCYGAKSPKFGALESLYQMNQFNFTNHHLLAIQSGLLSKECGQVLQDYFRQKRRLSLLASNVEH